MSTRPLVGNMLTLLDLLEKIVTRHTCEPKKVETTPKNSQMLTPLTKKILTFFTFFIRAKRAQGPDKRPIALTVVPKDIRTKWNSSKTNGHERLIANAQRHRQQSSRDHTQTMVHVGAEMNC